MYQHICNIKHIDELKHDKLVKIISHKLSLSSGIEIRIDDYKPKCFNDDEYYKKTKSLYMRRGVSAVYVKDVFIFLCVGMVKFGYIDDIFTDPPDYKKLISDKKIYTVKENGEAGHLTFFNINDKWYAIIGSKNVHIVASVNSVDEYLEDLNMYKGYRYSCAITNAKILLECYKDIIFTNTTMKQKLFENNMTIVLEFINKDKEHIVDYCKNNFAIAFSITQPQNTSIEEQGLCFPLEEGFLMLSEWGMLLVT